MSETASVRTFHWSQWLCPGPRRVFSAEEMARAGQQPWPKAIDSYVLSNVFILLAVNWQQFETRTMLLASLASLPAAWLALRVAQWLWRRPTRLRLNGAILAATALMMVAALTAKHTGVERELLKTVALIVLTAFALGSSAWWFLVILRVQQIEARLAELAAQAHGLSLARRLATAQIQPHFLFNTLASVQHWVDTQDPRAAGTLRAFTDYLRATLPMFDREALSLGEELQIVRSYLAVMQARLGARLTWTLASPAESAELAAQPLPPGVLLTLVENAIAHGIEPALAGGHIEVSAQKLGAVLRLAVSDSGVGLAEAATDGVGLTNTRTRLQQQFGARARLTLSALNPGCRATIDIDIEDASA